MTHAPEHAKPLLIAIEGPAGAGKTSLARALSRRLVDSGLSTVHLTEFSDTFLGVRLDRGSSFGSEKSTELLGLPGLLAYLSDKIYQFTRAAGYRVAVSERCALTQLVLGVPSTFLKAERESALAIIAAADRWARSFFASGSLVVHLTCPVPMLIDRLASRLQRPLESTERAQVQYEVAEYSRLFSKKLSWQAVDLDSTRNPEELVNEIYKLLLARLVLDRNS